MMWTDKSVFYQIYPLGAFGAPFKNDGQLKHRILKIRDWIPKLKELGIDAVLFNPVFQSISHGYDTTEFLTVDCRLGTNEDLTAVVDLLHDNGIRVLLDGVFNHVGRDFFAFQDVLKTRENSIYKDWFYIDFCDNNRYDDRLSYQDWEGESQLVKLNLQNGEVISYLLEVIDRWIDDFHIDGIRLDVAYLLDHQFLKTVRSHCKARDPEFFLLGETLHGDYNVWVNTDTLDSCTNYECYKGLFSSYNSKNFYEILYSLNRQFGKDPWCLYRGKSLFNFVDNHDVPRIATQLKDAKHLPLIYVTLFTMPGIPCIYYGSEWGITGNKNWNDTELRPEVKTLERNELTEWIRKLIEIKHTEPGLWDTDYQQIAITNTACIYQRNDLWIGINMSSEPASFQVNRTAAVRDLITNKTIHISNELQLDGYQALILKEN